MRNHLSLLLLLALAGCTPAAPESPASAPARIADDVYSPYEREQYPDLFQLLASEADPEARIQRARETFATKVAAHPECLEVELSEISTDASSSESLHVFAYCNGATDRFRFRSSESALDGSAPVSPDLACPLSGGACRRI